ncbi:hypothetical protein P7K49_021931, partial [Saguinus oedipus]
MCRECCEYDQIECVCPGKKEVVGYTIPCCRNEENECDSCLIHPVEKEDQDPETPMTGMSMVTSSSIWQHQGPHWANV